MQKPIEALKNSGKKNGLEVWVVKTIKPRQSTFNNLLGSEKPEVQYEIFSVSPRQHGVFHSDDLYLVLRTNTDTKQKDLHFWFGKTYNEIPPPWVDNFESLDLDWTANQHYEFQGLECELFESYFDKIQPVIRYKKGSHPNPSAEKARGVTRFYKLERHERGSYRIREIPFNIALMTKEECFILDTDYNTRAYISDRTPMNDRNKSMLIANHIRDLDHDGNGDTEMVDLTTFTNDADKEAYVKAMENIQDVTPPRETDFDQPDEDPKDAQLSMVAFVFSDDVDVGYPPRFRYIPKPKKSVPEVKNLSFCARTKKAIISRFQKLLGRKEEKEDEEELPYLEDKFVKTAQIQPIKREMLNTKKCYMLEGTIGKGIFLWAGKACDPALKEELMECLRNELKKGDNKNEEYVNKDFLIEEIGTEVYEKKEDKKEETNEEVSTPRWTHIQKVVEGSEPLKFKRYFQDWDTADQ